MLVHFPAKVCLVTPKKTASRWQDRVAQSRGFVLVGNRHTGPTDADARGETEADRMWWESNPREFRYVTTVRNHYTLIRSLWSISGGRLDGGITVGWLEEFLWGQPRILASKRRLFRWVHQLPDPMILRFETIRQDTNNMLHEFGLKELDSEEFPHDQVEETPNKPSGEIMYAWTPSAIQWMQEWMGDEMRELGYGMRV